MASDTVAELRRENGVEPLKADATQIYGTAYSFTQNGTADWEGTFAVDPMSGQINWDAGKVQQGNFDDHPVLRLADAPSVETHFVEAGEALGGLGEPSTALVAPAVCNAIFAATGKRLRSLPIVKAGFTVA